MFTRRLLTTNLILAVLSTALFSESVEAGPINWRNNLDAAKVEAGRTGKLILLHFYTTSCGPCKKLERDVFSQPQIAVAMQRDFIPVKINADQAPALANAYQISRIPTEVILSSQGSVLQKLSCPLEPAAYGAQLANVAQHYRGRPGNITTSVQAPVNSAYSGLRIGQSYNAQTASAVPTAYKAPQVPTVTQNPYVTAAPPTAQQTAAAPVAQQQPVAPVTPANAMPNSYRNRYAAVASAPVAAKHPPVTPTATAPQVAAVAPTAAAPSTTASTTAPPAATTAPTVKQVAAAAWPPQLPAGTPPLAFDGFCPVSLQQAQKWVRGNKTYGAIHRGRTYLFVGEAERQKFLAAPDAYSPVFSGNDPVMMLDENVQVAGSRKFGCSYQGAFYLFSSKETMDRFAKQPVQYSAGVRQAMNHMDASASGTIRR
ncbi:MAG: DUF255 domain-containing protein [Planctomycetes bacterium]|nr:DUF255 domain-containing protein [Planctomycetota bacterium]